MRSIVLIMGLLAWTMAGAVGWTYNGVLTQGVFLTDHNNIYGNSENNTSFDFTEISLNGSYNFPRVFRLAGQGIYRHAGAGFDGTNLDYFFLESQLVSTKSLSGGLRLGRIKIPHGIYNDSRDILLTRPSIYLPQSVYQDVSLRQSLLSHDGAGLYADYFTDYGQWSIELMHGKVNGGSLENYEILAGLTEEAGRFNEIKADDGSAFRIQFLSDSQQFLASVSGVYTTLDAIENIDPNSFITLPPPGPPFFLPIPPLPTIQVTNEIPIAWYVASMQYVYSDWTLTAEYSNMFMDIEDPDITLGPSVYPTAFILAGIGNSGALEKDRILEAFYFQIEKKMNRYFDVLVRYDVFYRNKHDRDGDEVVGYIPHSRFSKDSTLGLRWKPIQDLQIYAEYHYIDGTGWLSPAEQPGFQTNSTRYWNAVAMSASYRF